MYYQEAGATRNQKDHKVNSKFFIFASVLLQAMILLSFDLLTNKPTLATEGHYLCIILFLIVSAACIMNLWLIITLVNFAGKYIRAYDALTQSIRKGDGYEI